MRNRFIKIIALPVGVGISVVLGFIIFQLFEENLTRASDIAPYNVESQATTTSTTITWETGQSSQAVVYYGTNKNDLNAFVPEIEPGTSHRIEIDNLDPVTTYYYAIQVGDTMYDNGGAYWSFETPPRDMPDVPEPTRVAPTRGDDMRKGKPLIKERIKDEPLILDSSSVQGASTCSISSCEDMLTDIGKVSGCTNEDYERCLNAM